MRFTRIVALFLTVAIPCVVYAQQSKIPTPISQTMEGTVIGMDGTKYWSGFKIESGGKEYTFVTEYNAKQGTNPTVVGGKCCDIGTKVRVTYIGSPTRYLLNVTHIVILDVSSSSQFMPPESGIILVPIPANTAQERRVAKVASQTPTKEIGRYRYMPVEKPDGKIHNPLERRPQMFGTITLTDVGITVSGEQPSGNSQPERCGFFDSPATTLGRSNTKIQISWNDSRDLFSVNGYGCHLQFETQQERDRFFVDFTRTFQEWKNKYTGFEFAAGKLTINWPCTRGKEAAPCADSTPSSEKPVWQSATYRVTVESLERNANKYIASLVFENLTNESIKIGWEQKSNLLPSAVGPYLIDDRSQKYFVDGPDSANIITSSFVGLERPAEIRPKSKLTSRFVFSGSGDGKIFNLEAKTIDWPRGMPITIEGLKVTTVSEVKPDSPMSVSAPSSSVEPLTVAVLPNPESIVTDAFNAYRKGNSGGVSALMSEQGMSNSDIYCQGAAMNCLKSNYAGVGELKSIRTRALEKSDSEAKIVLQTIWLISGYENRRCQTYQLDMTKDGWRITFFDVPQTCSE